ncbi:MAG TPA: hypothetical protein VJ964_15770 [Balneolaceae bacterium]|nr:hypothetical protein [Balneolaceae bacterium]
MEKIKCSGVGILFIVMAFGACKTVEPKPEVRFLRQADRQDWKAEIDSGEVGFYGQRTKKLIGLDVAPHTKGYPIIVPMMSMSTSCSDYLSKKGPQVTTLEFLVDKKGTPSQFYVLKSAGPCDTDAASAVKQTDIIPGKENHMYKAALVHMRVRFTYMQGK